MRCGWEGKRGPGGNNGSLIMADYRWVYGFRHLYGLTAQDCDQLRKP